MFFVKTVLDFVTLAEYRFYIETSLVYLNNALEQIHETKKLFRNTQISAKNPEGDFNILKFYIFTHYIEFIRLYGSAVNMIINIDETAYKILLKAYYDRTNK